MSKKQIEVKEVKNPNRFDLVRNAFYFFIQDELHINMFYSEQLADKFLERLKVFEEKGNWAEVKKHFNEESR